MLSLAVGARSFCSVVRGGLLCRGVTESGSSEEFFSEGLYREACSVGMLQSIVTL